MCIRTKELILTKKEATDENAKLRYVLSPEGRKIGMIHNMCLYTTAYLLNKYKGTFFMIPHADVCTIRGGTIGLINCETDLVESIYGPGIGRVVIE